VQNNSLGALRIARGARGRGEKMSKKYREKFGSKKPSKQQLRRYFQRPGAVDENGKIQYTTEQNHKLECDVNNIIKKYDKTGLILHVSKIEAKYGDMTGMDFQRMNNIVAEAKTSFNLLPAEIRKEFENSPEKLLTFMEDPENREKAIELGLIDADWTEDTDGLGEHVKEGENIKKSEVKETEGKNRANQAQN